MIKKLRRKFIIITMILFSVLLLLVLVVVNIAFNRGLDMIESEYLKVLAYSDVNIPEKPSEKPAEDDNDHSVGFLDRMLRPTGYDTVCFIRVDDSGQVLDITAGEEYDTGELQNLTQEILDAGSSDGQIGIYRFSTARLEGGYQIAVVDNRVGISVRRYFVNISMATGCGILLLIFVIAWFLSRFVARPARDAVEEQKRFVADISHDLKTPLSAISINTTVLEEEVGSGPQLDNIRTETGRMMDLVQGMLELNSSENLAQRLEKKNFNLSETAGLKALSYESAAYEQGVSLETEIDKDCICCGDEEQIRKVIDILMDNAFYHVSPQGWVKVSLRSDHGKYRLCVSNSGEPVPAADLSHIFDRFYRGDKSRTADGRYGLGLSIAKEIVEAHNGRITCENGEDSVSFLVIL